MTATVINESRAAKVKQYHPAGWCIYCGLSGVRLTDEHIIPFGLGGTYILPKASCEACAKITGRIERQCLRTMFGDLRRWRNIRGRKRRDKDKDIPRPMFAYIGDNKLTPYSAPDPKHRLSASFMYALHEPTILRGFTPLDRKRKPFAAMWVNANLGKEASQVLRKATRPEVTRLASVASFHPELFGKMLAKIAYSFAMAEASGQFVPIIGLSIIGKEPWFHNFLVGGDPREIPPSSHTSELQLLRVPSTRATQYLMVRIRLFGDLGAPVYFIVVGELSPLAVAATTASPDKQ